MQSSSTLFTIDIGVPILTPASQYGFGCQGNAPLVDTHHIYYTFLYLILYYTLYAFMVYRRSNIYIRVSAMKVYMYR